MFTTDYWNARVLKYGHTGHGEPFYYCFDQEARKYAIQALIEKTDFKRKNKALDFGCGSGDFITLLLEHFNSVVGFDISEKIIEKTKQRYAGNKSITVTTNFNDIEKQAPYDLALSVTVLQNLNQHDLGNEVRALYKNLNAGGYLISLDAFASAELNHKQGLDKATTSDWLAAINEAGFTLVSSSSFYNPVLFPTQSWKLYNEALLLKLLKPLKQFQFAQTIFSKKAKEIIYREKDILHDQNSIFKIYILKK